MLIQLGKISSIAEMRKILTEEFNVRTLEIPNDKIDRTKTYGSDAWLYFHYPALQGTEAVYIAAFTPATLTNPSTPEWQQVTSYKERPHGNHDLIIFKNGASRLIFLFRPRPAGADRLAPGSRLS